MRRTTHRMTVLACALAWFLIGLHLPALHAMTHHEAPPAWPVIGLVAILALVAVAALWALLRESGSEGRARSPDSPAI